MSNKSKKRIKKYIIPGTALGISSSVSIPFTIGTALGYLGINFFYKRFIKPGRVEFLTIGLGNWEIHIHHWIMGLIGIILVYLINVPFMISLILTGGLIALSVHDFLTDKEWYRIIYRKQISETK